MPDSAHTNSDHVSSTASRAAAAAVQTRLSVGPANDSYEQEADRVASRAVDRGPGGGPAAAGGDGSRSAAGSVSVSAVPTISRLVRRTPQERMQRQEEKQEPQARVQRQAEEEEPQARVQRQAEEEEPQARIQRQAEDEEPQAAVQRQAEEEEPQARVQRQAEEEEPQARIQRQAEDEEPQASVQRQAEDEEPQARVQRQGEEEEPQAKIQRRIDARANVRDKQMYPQVGRVENKIFESKGKGEPLPDDARVQMETSMRADFSKVRVHTGGDAERMNRELRANAFTHGSDIFFNAGQYEPDSVRGKMLLAHELTHVVQQGATDQKLSEEKVGKNNATKDQPPPEPTDKKSQQVEQQTQTAKEERDAEIEKPAETAEQTIPSPGPEGGGEPVPEGGAEAAAGAEGAAPEAGAEGTEEAEGAEKTEEGAEAGKKAPGKKAPPKKGAPAAGKKAPAKDKAGEGVGAHLRMTTQAAVDQKKARVEKLAADKKKKDPAEEKLKQTEKAVEPPAEEGPSRAKASQVETVDQAPEPEPDKDQAKKEFDEAMENAVPNSLEEVDSFSEEGKGRIVGEKVSSVVTQDTQDVKETYKKVEDTPEPVPPEAEPEALPEMEATPESPPLDMGDGVVGEVKPEHTDLSEFEKESDEMLEKEGISEEQLEMVDEGDLAEAKKDRKQVKENVQKHPKEVQKLQDDEKQKVDAELKKEEQAGKKEMQADREKELKGAQEDQKKTKSKIELKRQAVTEHINGIYEKTNTTVQQKLQDLEEQSLKAFDKGQAAATKTFEDNVKRRIDAFKDRRYSGWTGPFKWAKDKLLGMDDLPEVKNIFDTEKNLFVTTIDKLVAKITADNEKVIQECRDLIAAAKQKIQEYVDGLGPDLRQTGQDALTAMKTKLDALDKQVEAKAEELKKKLAEKREAAIKAIEEKIEKMKSEMSGLVGKLGALLLAAALKFFKWALKKVGAASDQLMGVLNKGPAVLEKIVKDPVAFIKNIVTAVKTGINNFVANIKQHLVSGLISWLTGAMAGVPIQLPTTWDLKGIIYLIVQILGLTWDRIRTKLVKRLGEPVVAAVEKTVDIVKRLVTEGPMALWEMIREKAVEIKEQVMSGIRDWVVVQVVKQAVIKLLSFLNPAGAIIQAILAIYNTVMFFIENWDRIVEFVKTVVSSIGDIAMGKLSAAAAAVEKALAMTVPIILNFLARLIGLSGIGKTVTNIIKKIRRPIDKVVDKAVDKIVGYGKKLLKKAKKGVGKLKDKAKDLVVRFAQWWKKKKTFKAKDGSSHQVYYKGRGKSAVLMVASDGPDKVDRFLKEKLKAAKDNAEQKAAIGRAQKAYTELTVKEKALEDLQDTKKNPIPKDKAGKRKRQAAINAADKNLSTALSAFAASLTGLNFELESDLFVKTQVTPTSGAKADEVEAKPLTYLPGNTTGSTPGSASPPGWTHATLIDQDPATGSRRNQWVRGHLLNQQLHGPGANWNLVPITQKTNDDMKRTAEAGAKAAVAKKGTVIRYKTKVNFHDNQPDPVSHFPASITVRWQRLVRDGSGDPPRFKDDPKDKEHVYPFTQAAPPLEAEAADINTIGRDSVSRLTGAPVRFVMDYFMPEREAVGKFNNTLHFIKRMYDNQLPKASDKAAFKGHVKSITDASVGPKRKVKFR